VPAYLPANGLSGQPYATLMGRPIIITEACETLGDVGDLILADMSQYLLVTKAGGLRADVSIHLFFDYDLSAYRFILRIGGMPMWRSSIAKRDGSNTLSCFVTLAERS
jgi:HK97 family phage major capsid protein